MAEGMQREEGGECEPRNGSDGSLTNETLEIPHSSSSKMEAKSDIGHSLFEDGLSNKRSVRKRRPARRTAHMSASVGGETTSKITNTSPSDQTQIAFLKYGSLTNEMLEISHSSISKMEDKSDIDCSLCEDGLSNKRSVRKRRPARRATHMSASVGGETTSNVTNTSPSDQTNTSNFETCEKERLDGHNGFAEKQGCIETSNIDSCQKEKDIFSETQRIFQVKEEPASSGEEDTFCGEGEEQGSSREKNMGSIEVVLGKDSEHKQKVLKLNARRSKEISEYLRKQVVEAHKNGKGYKRIAKELDLPLSTVKSIMNKWKKFSTVATLPRSGRPTKIGAKARHTILKHMRENTMVSAKDLKASLALDNINVHESTIRKTMSKWCSWDFKMKEDTALQE